MVETVGLISLECLPFLRDSQNLVMSSEQPACGDSGALYQGSNAGPIAMDRVFLWQIAKYLIGTALIFSFPYGT
jgi:hypothetical protein